MQLAYAPAPYGPSAYRSWGQDVKDIVLLHGWLAHSYWWRWTVEGARWAGRAMAYDLYGMGRSPWQASYRLVDHASQVAHGLTQPVHLVGHSYGGLVAYAVAVLYPNRVRSVVLLDSPLSAWDSSWSLPQLSFSKRIQYASDVSELYARFSLMPAQAFPSECVKEALFSESICQTRRGYRWRFDPALLVKPVRDFRVLQEAINVPVLYLAAEYGLGDLSAARACLGSLASLSVAEIKDSHHAILLDQPHILGRWIEEVVSSSA